MEERIAYIQKMLNLTPDQEARHKLVKQPWFIAMDPQMADQVVHNTLEYAKDIYDKLQADFGICSAGEYAFKLEVTAQHSKDPASEFFLHFALFQTPPPTITLTDSSINLTEEYIQKKNLEGSFAGVDVGDFALAHELYHVMEDKYPELYASVATATTKRKSFTGRTKKVPIRLLGEIAACRFSQLVLDTNVTASSLEAVLTYAFRDNQKEMLEQNTSKRWKKTIDMLTKLRPNKKD